MSVGSNNCCSKSAHTASSVKCCSAGFAAAAGWDPVTGLGSVTYPNLLAMLTDATLPPLSPSLMPTKAPDAASSSDSKVGCFASGDTVEVLGGDFIPLSQVRPTNLLLSFAVSKRTH